MHVSQLHNETKTKKGETLFSLSSFIKNIFKLRWLPGELLDDWDIVMNETHLLLVESVSCRRKETITVFNHMVY